MCIICDYYKGEHCLDDTRFIRCCKEVEHIPYLPNLTRLVCRRCVKLTYIPDLPNLEELNCTQSGIVKFGNLPKLHKLDINMSPITSIPSFSMLTSLTCVDCEQLVNISCSPKLFRLNCRGCIKLKKIPSGLTSLHILQCDECCIEKIPEDMENLNHLECSENMYLTEVPKTLKNIESIYCYDCPLLISIPDDIYYSENTDTPWLYPSSEIMKDLVRCQRIVKKWIKRRHETVLESLKDSLTKDIILYLVFMYL